MDDEARGDERGGSGSGESDGSGDEGEGGDEGNGVVSKIAGGGAADGNESAGAEIDVTEDINNTVTAMMRR